MVGIYNLNIPPHSTKVIDNITGDLTFLTGVWSLVVLKEFSARSAVLPGVAETISGPAQPKTDSVPAGIPVVSADSSALQAK